MFDPLTARLSPLLMPGGRLARHQTLIFHRVFSSRDEMMPNEPTLDWFDEIIGSLVNIFNVIPLRDAIVLASRKSLPPASLSITFDDGYADNFTNALPILHKHKAHATFFVASGFLDGGRMWNDTITETLRNLAVGSHMLPFEEDIEVDIQTDLDRRNTFTRALMYCRYLPDAKRTRYVEDFARRSDAKLPDDLMMTSDQLREMSDSPYAEIGAHTQNHPILANCTEKQVREELINGIDDLERITGIRPDLFAYPNGRCNLDYHPYQTAFVKDEGVTGAVTTDLGVMTATTDPLQIPRFTPWTIKPTRFIFDLLRARYGLLRAH